MLTPSVGPLKTVQQLVRKRGGPDSPRRRKRAVAGSRARRRYTLLSVGAADRNIRLFYFWDSKHDGRLARRTLPLFRSFSLSLDCISTSISLLADYRRLACPSLRLPLLRPLTSPFPSNRSLTRPSTMLHISRIAVSLVAIFLLPLVKAAALVPRASGVPTCLATCPSTIYTGYNLDSQTYDSVFVNCRYKTAGGSTRSCYYNKNTGTGSNSFGIPACPSSVGVSCSLSRREARGVYQAYQEQRRRRVAQPVPTVPEYMKKRAALKKRRAAD
ncbi:hypothetical protein NMY22_g13122 [Coprinellus aureogranulatus]|nr:hypothetical protein NMY22_g13122 [Coprinellus aureogranulatus]